MASVTSKRSDEIIRLWGRPYGESQDKSIAPVQAKEVPPRNENRQPRKSRLTLFNGFNGSNSRRNSDGTT